MRGVLKVQDKPESPNLGACLIYDEPHWSGVFKVYDNRIAKS